MPKGLRMAKAQLRPSHRRSLATGVLEQQLMTRAEFEAWFGKQRNDVYVRPPYELAPCDCGDLNCHGWRFIRRVRK
jgi:hypothetical protein